MIPFTLLFVFLAALAPWVYATHEAGIDAGKIAADGSADSLKEGFHSGNLKRRALVSVGLSVLFTALLMLCGFRWWFLFPYMFYFAAAFGYTFTTGLNAAREPRLPRFYVSLDSRAAVSDRLLVKFAAILHITPERFAAIVYTGFLVAGILAFAGAIVDNVLRINAVNAG